MEEKKVANYLSVIAHFKKKKNEIQTYYEHLEKLLKEFPVDIALTYCFSRLELAHNQAIKCGLVKKLKTDSDLTTIVVDKWYITRADYMDKFKEIYKSRLSKETMDKFNKAAEIRDNVMHGKNEKDENKRKAIINLLDYSDDLMTFLIDHGGANVFGDLRGYSGKAPKLNKEISKWILKGMEFVIE